MGDAGAPSAEGAPGGGSPEIGVVPPTARPTASNPDSATTVAGTVDGGRRRPYGLACIRMHGFAPDRGGRYATRRSRPVSTSYTTPVTGTSLIHGCDRIRSI